MPGKPLPKLSTKKPYSNIRKWIYEKDKKYVPNPMKPLKFKTTREKISDFNKLGRILEETHSPGGKINKIIEEVNDQLKRVTVNETDISIIQKRLDMIENTLKMKSTRTHTHASGAGPTGPPMGRKGGSIRGVQNSLPPKAKKGRRRGIPTLQSGGKFTRPVITDINATKEKLINKIKQLQNQNSD